MNKGDRTRRDIVNTALSLAGDVGLEGVTLGTLATDLDLSKSGLFAHFKSKEALQQAVLAEAIARFSATVVVPALATPRGEPRLAALFDRWLGWIIDRTANQSEGRSASARRGRCIFMALSQEYDDRPGELRDAVAASQREWRAFLTTAARLAVTEGHFAADTDVQQIAFEMVGIAMTFQQTTKLLADPTAERRARAAFDALLVRYRVRRRATRRASR